MSDSFMDWLNNSEPLPKNSNIRPRSTTATAKAKPKRVAKQPITLNAELAKPMGIVGGLTPGGKGNSKRTGYVGARLHDSSITSDCVVTTAAGDTYTLRRSRTKTVLTASQQALIRTIEANRREHMRTAQEIISNLPAIGNID